MREPYENLGEVIDYEGEKIEVVEGSETRGDCSGCCFDDGSPDCFHFIRSPSRSECLCGTFAVVFKKL